MKNLFSFLTILALLVGHNFALSADESSTTLIKRALERGEIDSESALVYKTLSVVAPQTLPDAFKPDSPTIDKCATLPMLELAASWPDLSPEAKETLKPFLVTRPKFIPKNPALRQKTVFQSSLPNTHQTTNFNIEWGNTTPSITEWQDISPANGTPDYIDNMATYFETIWTYEITTSQLKEPLQSSSYLVNVYIGNTGDGAPGLSGLIYGYATVFPFDPGLSGPSGMAYMVMNDDYTRFPANQDPDGTFQGAAKVTAAHEFFHTVQFAYDIQEAGWIMEMSSTWIEDEIYDQTNDYYAYLTGNGGWQMYPETSIAYFNGMHEYGDIIFAKYLSEKYPGVNIMKELWEILDDVSGDNALSAVNTFLGNQAIPSTLTTAFKDFSAKNATMDYSEGANYGGYGASDKMFHQEAITAYPAIDNSYSNYLPDYLGSNYVKFTNAAAASTLQISFNGNSTFAGKSITWGVAAVAVRAAGGYDVFEFTLDSSNAGVQSVASFGAAGTYDKIYLLARVLSPTGVTPSENSFTPYGSYPSGVPYSFSAVLGDISVSPTSASLIMEDTQQFTASGGTAPYSWTTSDSTVGTISASGLFTAVAAGVCTVIASDAASQNGISSSISVAANANTMRPEERDLATKLCFIATAAYGSPLAEEVGILCQFRDRFLAGNTPGRWFIRTYYRLSPPAADYITEHPVLKFACRIMLKPVIYLAVFLLYSGWLPKVIMCLAVLTLSTAFLLKKTTVAIN